MNSPTHADVAHRAHQNWLDHGSPAGRDTEIWLEAERQLTAGLTPAGTHETSQTLSESRTDTAIAEKAALQKKIARAPVTSHIVAPTAKPPETGKPLWSKPHSS